MDKSTETVAQQIAQAAIALQEKRTGHVPKAVTVVLTEDTLVVGPQEGLAPPGSAWKEVDDVDLTENTMRRSRGGAAVAAHRR